MPVLMRPVSDTEARLGAGMIEHLARLGGAGLTDATAEIAIACMLAMYAEHRREMGDAQALQRMLDSALSLYRDGRFRLLTGDDHARFVADEYAAGRLKV
jgi:hypothetical protein